MQFFEYDSACVNTPASEVGGAVGKCASVYPTFPPDGFRRNLVNLDDDDGVSATSGVSSLPFSKFNLLCIVIINTMVVIMVQYL